MMRLGYMQTFLALQPCDADWYGHQGSVVSPKVAKRAFSKAFEVGILALVRNSKLEGSLFTLVSPNTTMSAYCPSSSFSNSSAHRTRAQGHLGDIFICISWGLSSGSHSAYSSLHMKQVTLS